MVIRFMNESGRLALTGRRRDPKEDNTDGVGLSFRDAGSDVLISPQHIGGADRLITSQSHKIA